MFVAAGPRRAARAGGETVASEEQHQHERQERRGNQQQRHHRLGNDGMRRDQRQRNGVAQLRQQPRRGDAARDAAQRQCDHAYAHQ